MTDADWKIDRGQHLSHEDVRCRVCDTFVMMVVDVPAPDWRLRYRICHSCLCDLLIFFDTEERKRVEADRE